MPIDDIIVWEWCDLEHENLVRQTESNWHSYSEELSQLIEETSEACGLCTELFENTKEWTRRTTPCKHTFHYSCLQAALHFCNKCPLCRTSLQGISAVDLPH